MKVLNKILGDGASKLLESVGSIVDNLVTTDAEKKEAKRKLKELVLNHQAKIESNITDRWKVDMASDSWLSKNVRPLVLVFVIVCTMLLIFIDAGFIDFKVEGKWVDMLQLLLITIVASYFGGRSIEKVKKKQYE